MNRSRNNDKHLLVPSSYLTLGSGKLQWAFSQFLDILLSNHSIYHKKSADRSGMKMIVSCSPTCVIMCFILPFYVNLPVFCAFLQRVMRPVWWIASWKLYSLEQPSAIGENGHHATVMQQQGFHVPLYNCCCFCPPVLYLATFSCLSHRSSFALWFVFH